MGLSSERSGLVAEWLANSQAHSLTCEEIISGLCQLLLDLNVELFRVSAAFPSLHSLIRGRQVVWERGRNVRTIIRPHGILDTFEYRKSPAKVIHDGATFIRQRIWQSEGPEIFPVIEELKTAGATDYFAMPIPFSTGVVGYISWTTDAPNGFDETVVTDLLSLTRIIALRCELESTNFSSKALLASYLGKSAAKEVLGGNVKLGQSSSMTAAIWFSDLRNFTKLADQCPPNETLMLLNSYFEALTKCIQDRNGEVLKYIGDGILAIFPIGSALDSVDACRNAKLAALESLSKIDAINLARKNEERIISDVGIALHVGEVAFGNIGAPDRLDFTVIGPCVNLAARIEGLCSKLNSRLLVSAEFAANSEEFTSLGSHNVKGIDSEIEVFRPETAKK